MTTDLPDRLDPAPRPHRRPHDLEAGERDVAAWFAHLPRAEPPAGLRAAVLGHVVRPLRAAWVARFPLGAWGLASAAMLLLAFGAVLTVEIAYPTGGGAIVTGAPQVDGLARVVIVEDPTMALFHDVETFDEVGLAPGDLIADWGR